MRDMRRLAERYSHDRALQNIGSEQTTSTSNGAMAFSTSEGLKLLTAYNSSGEESEDEVPGPRVSSKRTHSSLESPEDNRKKQATGDRIHRLPPPSAILQLFQDKNRNEEHEDTRSEHNGRIRSFPHERGNWASYVFIAVEPTPALQSFIDVVCASCESSLNVQRSSDLHISLTRTVILKHHWIESISSSVQKVAQCLPRFAICLGDIKVYTNEEQTRTFIGIVVSAGQEILNRIVQKLDEVLADFKLPPFYEEASYHLSIVSCPGNHADALQPVISKLQTSLKMFIFSEPLQWSLNVEKLQFRTGNKYFAFNLMN